MKILITGVAGFIGYHTAKHLLDNGYAVVGLDNFDPYYDVQLKRDRIDRLPGLEFYNTDILNLPELRQVFENHSDFSAIIHLAALPGVEGSFRNAHKTIDVNIKGFQNILDLLLEINPVAHLVYASSSSVYGDEDTPKSPYGVSKLSNELMAAVYAQAYGIASTGLRFHTVYGPWGRPDMAIYKFVDAIMAGRHIELYNMGENERDFTFVDDAVNSIELALSRDIESDPQLVYDIGSGQATQMLELIRIIEKTVGRKAKKYLDVAKKGDIIKTCASIEPAEDELGYRPTIDLAHGVKQFVQWYLWYTNEHLLEKDSAGDSVPRW